MWRNLDGPEIFVTAPSEIVFADGVFHAVEKYSDGFVVRKVYTPAIFAAAIAVAEAAWEMFEREQRAAAENIAQFRRKLPG